MRAPIPIVALVAASVACESDSVDTVAAFATPSGLAVAGTATDQNGDVIHRLFVSNSGQDTVQVLNLGDDLNDVEFVFGPAQRVPLRIPAGLGPADLAASRDGRYVVVLNLISESLRLIDADRLLLARDDAGTVLQLPLGPTGSRPSAMVASPADCGDSCSGRVYVTLAGSGAITAADIIEDTDGPRLIASRHFAVGGEPAALAIRGDGRVLFATDSAHAELIRVDLETGAFERRDLGGIGGPVAVSTDGSAVVVGRPNERDLVVFQDADAGLRQLEVNPAWAPSWQCRLSCDASTTEECENSHPADLSLCESEAGIESVAGAEYDAIYIGEVSTHLVALGEAAGHPAVVSECSDGDLTFTRAYSESVAVALLDGNVMFLGLRRGTDGPLAPELINTAFCGEPVVSASTVDLLGDVIDSEVRLDDYLAACPEVPDGRARMQCLQTSIDATAGVVISPGNTGSRVWSLSWEGTIIDRTDDTGTGAGAGLILEKEVGVTCGDDSDCPVGALCNIGQGACVESVFTDVATEIPAVRGCTTISGATCTRTTDPSDIAYPGDVLVIRTSPLALCRATPCDGASSLDWRVFERTILAVDTQEERTFLSLDRAIEPGCFREDGEIEFRIRANGHWTAVTTNGAYRASPGQRVGIAGDVGRSESEMFDLLPRVLRPELSACERYTVAVDSDGNGENEVEEGLVACEDPTILPGETGCDLVVDPELARHNRLRVSISDAFSIFRSGLAVDSSRNASGTAGLVPGGMIVSSVGVVDSDGTLEPVMFLSYAGTDGVLGFVPFDVVSSFETAGRYTLLQ